MGTPALGKTWEGRVVDGKFPLRQWLGGSSHSAVFLTETGGKDSAKAAIKLTPEEKSGNGRPDADQQLKRWAAAAKFSHPHLLKIRDYGRCQVDDKSFLYVATEFAEENLREILPMRPLAPDEARGMLQPAAEALAYLHQSGMVHGSIKPSNIMAAGDQLKISVDTLCPVGELAKRETDPYDAPEVAMSGVSAAADSWSLGATLVAVMTQKEPRAQAGKLVAASVPESIPQPLLDIARGCLQFDPQRRMTASQILSGLQNPRQESPPVAAMQVNEVNESRAQTKQWVIGVAAVALLLVVGLIASRITGHSGTTPVSENQVAAPAESPTTQAPALSSPVASPPAVSASSSETTRSAPSQAGRGSVLHKVLPEVSRGAQNTITGRVKVSVQVNVDENGKVTQAKFAPAGPSKYFAKQAMEASRGWTFAPPHVNGRAVASEWILRFEFGRGSTQVFPSEIKP